MPRGIKIEDLPARYQRQALSQLAAAASSGDPGKDGEPKRTACDALEKGSQTPKIGKAVYLVVLLYRTGTNFDLDNASIKPFLDGVIQAGMVEDDNCKQIQGLIKLPRKVSTKSEERTELEFWDAEYFEAYIESARRFRREG